MQRQLSLSIRLIIAVYLFISLSTDSTPTEDVFVTVVD